MIVLPGRKRPGLSDDMSDSSGAQTCPDFTTTTAPTVHSYAPARLRNY